ncbi:hypothetical protein [Burkholderia vietnamiensis]|uniref:hypothetical protein n=1 Tax=Burkholderia vietnamiensis TaxID=60552 RepID=UPI0010411CBD|nr:hypothetical protein [Burkholderia vietnamiensis]
MKATILTGGALLVTPESELDAYALAQWSKANLPDWFNAASRHVNVIVDVSAYPGAIEPLTIPQPQAGRRTQP